ncbi:MAG: TIGR03862 family flavoprotein [Bacteroidetes bacterium]|nr:TIGR03862 family flavoprotein [Bacteroidota bacterium]
MKKTLSIVGGGACALFLGCALDADKYEITIYERNVALGRKFLVAGDGGLNLTHSESLESFIKRYTPENFLLKPLRNFTNEDYIKWINELGIKTFVGTSGRVFPIKGAKPIEVLNAIIGKLKDNSVKINYKHYWQGFSESNELLFTSNEQIIKVKSDVTVFCLGGASWPSTGSKGEWSSLFSNKGVIVNPFKASNCNFKIEWKDEFIDKAQGKALKNISLSCNGKTRLGEVVITKFGIEGSGIYPLSPEIRNQLDKEGKADLTIDLKPNLSLDTLEKLFVKLHPKKNITEILKTDLKFSQVQVHLLKYHVSKENFVNPHKVAFRIKNINLSITGTAPLEDAISTVGGISLNEINANFALKKMSNVYAIGEMLDYDAPTGGYLLQSCFSMSKYLAAYLNKEAFNKF